MSPSSPWNIGRSGSRSNRSTSSTPRSLVSMITGICRSRAASRTRNFMSSESHSSMTRSSPSRNSPEVLRANAGRFDDDAQVRIDLGDSSRGDHRLVDARGPSTLAGIRFRFESSSVSKSARRISPAKPSIAITWAMVCPGAQSDDADAQRALTGLFGAGQLVAVAVESQRRERLRARAVARRRGATGSRPSASPRSAVALETGGMISPSCSRCSANRSMICSAESSRRIRRTSRCARSPTSKISGRLARLRVEAGSIGPSPMRDGPRKQLLGLASIGLLILGGREFVGPPALPRDGDRAVALVGERHPLRSDLQRRPSRCRPASTCPTPRRSRTRRPASSWPCVTEREMAVRSRAPTTAAPLDHAPLTSTAPRRISLVDQIVDDADLGRRRHLFDDRRLVRCPRGGRGSARRRRRSPSASKPRMKSETSLPSSSSRRRNVPSNPRLRKIPSASLR